MCSSTVVYAMSASTLQGSGNKRYVYLELQSESAKRRLGLGQLMSNGVLTIKLFNFN